MEREDIDKNEPHIIAGTYQILQQIGSGGGGIVYLGRHLRLDKMIVLKADRRTQKIAKDELRREADILKNLNQTYIPQVYDFVEENGIVYTVEDFISGESLDKLLKRKEKIPQSTIIEWACEMLEALVYLHSQPPFGILHGDIKPANIMLRPNGTICLIDYNIALFLGADGAVQLGSSAGYASPEHYGIDYRTSSKTQLSRQTQVLTQVKSSAQTQISGQNAQTVYEDRAKTIYTPGPDEQNHLQQKSSSRLGVRVDVRSDIYSLGATLYHLLTGRRPAKNAKEVEPIGRGQISDAVAVIIEKAMQPNPDERYQTAAEMLYDFEHLYEHDKRTIKRRKRARIATAVWACLAATGGMTVYTGLRQMERRQNMYALAGDSQEALQKGDVQSAIELALLALPQSNSIFEAPATAKAQKALTDALGVYELSDGFFASRQIELPGEVFTMCMSPDGTRVAVLYAYEMAVYDLESGIQLAARPAEESALSEVEFLDNNTVVFAGASGVEVFSLQDNKVLWTGEKATAVTISEDKRTVAAVYKDSKECYVYDARTGDLRSTVDFDGRGQSTAYNPIFANPNDNVFELNADGSWLAVSFDDGSLEVFRLENVDDSVILSDASDFVRFEGGFYKQYFVFSAQDKKQSLCAIIDLKELQETGEFTLQSHIGVECDDTGIYISNGNLLVKMDPETGEQTSVAATLTDIISYMRSDKFTAAASDDNAYRVFTPDALEMQVFSSESDPDFIGISDQYLCVGSRSSTTLQVMKFQEHDQARLASYNAKYDHSEARVSSDNKSVMLFNYKGFLISDFSGEKICEVSLEDSDKIYDQQYLRQADGKDNDDGKDGNYLEVTYYDGTVNGYSAKNGSLAYTKKIDPPNDSLYEEFYTDEYRIASKLNGAPEVYSLKTGKKLFDLITEDYLTYVTQVGDYIVTEYLTAGGERYGLLLNEDCETLARLPTLCDIEYQPGTQNGEQNEKQSEVQSEVHFIFDDGLGNLRQSRLYSLDELVDMAKAWEETNADINTGSMSGSGIRDTGNQESQSDVLAISRQETKEGDLQ